MAGCPGRARPEKPVSRSAVSRTRRCTATQRLRLCSAVAQPFPGTDEIDDSVRPPPSRGSPENRRTWACRHRCVPLDDRRERPAFLFRKHYAVLFPAFSLHLQTPAAPPARCSRGRPAEQPPATRFSLVVANVILDLDHNARPNKDGASPHRSINSTAADYQSLFAGSALSEQQLLIRCIMDQYPGFLLHF